MTNLISGIRRDAELIAIAALEDMEMENEVYYDECEGYHYKSVFLGTVFALCPSGKYYMPFACSNVEVCSVCNGAGVVSNGAYNKEILDEMKEIEADFIQKLKDKNCTYWDMPKEDREDMDEAREIIRATEQTVQCPYCHGVGSREAYEDEEFYTALDAELEARGMYREHGEGDPCDVLAIMQVEVDEDGKE